MLFAASCFLLPAAPTPSLRKVVIDPGHGGKDPGCVSKDRKTYEKNLTLDISKRLAELIRRDHPDVEVLLTRDTDKTVSLDARAAVANKADADLFISVHINAVPSTSPNGYSVHVLGQSSHKDRDLFAYNMSVCQRENAVVKLDEDYSTKYQDFDPSDPESFIFMSLMQNAYLEQSLFFAQTVADKLSGGPVPHRRGVSQDPFYVLWKTSMPAVLLELGFISNSGDLAVLRKEESRQELAERLLSAFTQYKLQYDRSVRVGGESAKDSITAPVSNPSATQLPDTLSAVLVPADSDTASVGAAVAGKPVLPEPETQYGVQILASSNLLFAGDPAFMGYEPKIVRSGSLYKYVVAVKGSLSEVRNEIVKIRKKYPDAFIVQIHGDSLAAMK